MQIRLSQSIDIHFANAIDVEDSLADTNRWHVEEHPDVRSASEVTSVQDAVAIDEDELRVQLGLLLAQSVEEPWP